MDKETAGEEDKKGWDSRVNGEITCILLNVVYQEYRRKGAELIGRKGKAICRKTKGRCQVVESDTCLVFNYQRK